MLCGYALRLCFERLLWANALCVCFGRMLSGCVLGVCCGRMLWAYALGVCLSVSFKCMALECMALGASLRVRGFGRMSLGVWILPKKQEAKDSIDNLNLCSSLSLCESVSNF